MSDADTLPVLLCRVGAKVCALRLSDVSETMRPLPIETLAGAPELVLGVSVIRAAPVPVVDAAQLVGAERGAPPARFVTLKLGERRVALAVEQVLGVRNIPRSAMAAAPPLVAHASRTVVDSMGTLDAALLLVLESSRLVPDDVWVTLDAGRTA